VKRFEEAPGLWRFALQGSDVINAYVAGEVLIDSGTPHTSRKLVAALADHRISAHALTHAHFDHQGGSHAVCQATNVPLMCGAGDRDAAETGDWTRLLPRPHGPLARMSRLISGPGHPVSRVLRDGDRIGDLTAIETPGHTPGHLAFWRERDRILILGDVLFHRSPITYRRGLMEPFGFATQDPARNRESARKLAALEPSLICFGHGSPLADGGRFQRFVADLPA
jgi:glyoxylase-like metal-dependent hydrolase (beta-lactamase superfamily II)